jgi:hypothetical protein
MSKPFHLILITLLAYAGFASSLSIIACKEVFPDEKGITYGHKFAEAYDPNTIYNAVSKDGTIVQVIKAPGNETTSDHTNLVNIQNKDKGGPTRIALKFDRVEGDISNQSHIRFFKVQNGKSCAIALFESQDPQGRDVLKEASYFFVKD